MATHFYGEIQYTLKIGNSQVVIRSKRVRKFCLHVASCECLSSAVASCRLQLERSAARVVEADLQKGIKCCESFTRWLLLLERARGVQVGARKTFQCPHCLLVQRVQMKQIAVGRVWVSTPPLGVPTTQPTYIEWQITIHRSLPPLKILGQKAKSNH